MLNAWEEAIRLGYITHKGDIIKCPECGSTALTEITTDTINNITCEADIYCVECDNYVGYWAYGNYNIHDFVSYLVEEGKVVGSLI